MNQKNRILELLFYAVLSIVFIVLFFINKPYATKKPVQILQPAKSTVESQVNKYDAIPMQP